MLKVIPVFETTQKWKEHTFEKHSELQTINLDLIMLNSIFIVSKTTKYGHDEVIKTSYEVKLKCQKVEDDNWATVGARVEYFWGTEASGTNHIENLPIWLNELVYADNLDGQ